MRRIRLFNAFHLLTASMGAGRRSRGFQRRPILQGAVRALLVVVLTPLFDQHAGLGQQGKPVFVETFVAHLAVEAPANEIRGCKGKAATSRRTPKGETARRDGRLGEPSLPTAGGNSKGATRRLKPCGYGEQTEDGGDDRASKTIRGKRGAAKRRTAASGALALQSGDGTAGDWATT